VDPPAASEALQLDAAGADALVDGSDRRARPLQGSLRLGGCA
jgi:hypothetical protein